MKAKKEIVWAEEKNKDRVSEKITGRDGHFMCKTWEMRFLEDIEATCESQWQVQALELYVLG